MTVVLAFGLVGSGVTFVALLLSQGWLAGLVGAPFGGSIMAFLGGLILAGLKKRSAAAGPHPASNHVAPSELDTIDSVPPA